MGITPMELAQLTATPLPARPAPGAYKITRMYEHAAQTPADPREEYNRRRREKYAENPEPAKARAKRNYKANPEAKRAAVAERKRARNGKLLGAYAQQRINEIIREGA
jgi:hypothetical protein